MKINASSPRIIATQRLFYTKQAPPPASSAPQTDRLRGSRTKSQVTAKDARYNSIDILNATAGDAGATGVWHVG